MSNFKSNLHKIKAFAFDVDGVFTDEMTTSVITGWLEAESEEKINAEIYIIE